MIARATRHMCTESRNQRQHLNVAFPDADAVLRSEVCGDLGPLGIHIDTEKNSKRGTVDISGPKATTRVLVIPTDEEAQIAYDCLDCVH